jgi:hypothetical protein
LGKQNLIDVMKLIGVCFRAALITVAQGVLAQKAAVATAEQRAGSIHLPQVGFAEATLQDAVNFFQKRADESLSPERGLRISCEELGHVYLTLNMENQSMLAVMEEIARLTGLQLKMNGDSIFYALAGKPTAISAQKRDREEDRIFEVVLRYESSTGWGEVATCFVGIEDKDASDSLIRRLSGSKIPMRKLSVAKTDKRGFIVDSDGKPAETVTFQRPEWLSATKVRVSASFTKVGFEYELVHTTNGWRIAKKKQGWIE